MKCKLNILKEIDLTLLSFLYNMLKKKLWLQNAKGLWTLSFLPSKWDYWENRSFLSAQDFVKVI